MRDQNRIFPVRDRIGMAFNALPSSLGIDYASFGRLSRELVALLETLPGVYRVQPENTTRPEGGRTVARGTLVEFYLREEDGRTILAAESLVDPLEPIYPLARRHLDGFCQTVLRQLAEKWWRVQPALFAERGKGSLGQETVHPDLDAELPGRWQNRTSVLAENSLRRVARRMADHERNTLSF